MTVGQEYFLPEGTIVSEYRIIWGLYSGTSTISYLAESVQTGTYYRICEYFPSDLVRREGQSVKIGKEEDTEKFTAKKQKFLQRAIFLQKQTIPYMIPVVSVCEQAETVYCIMEWKETRPFSVCEVPLTASYLRSLGIGLCDLYAALHQSGFCFGTPADSDFCLESNGTLWIYPERWLADTDCPSYAEDLHRLTGFLGKKFPVEEESDEFDDLREVFGYTYADVAQLRYNLLCPDGTIRPPFTTGFRWKSFLCGLVCLIFLAVSSAVSVRIYQRQLSLRHCLECGSITPDTIQVCVPLRTGADEEDTVAMYQRLSEGFEQQYPDFGVNITLYADDSFSEVLTANGMENAAVLMDIQPEELEDTAADLSLLTDALTDAYIVDTNAFRNYIPLGCSFPAALFHIHAGEAMTEQTIALESIKQISAWDMTAKSFASTIAPEPELQEDALKQFLADPSWKEPILASTASLARIQSDPIASGDVRVLPVSYQGTYPIQYEYCCIINKNQDLNSRRIGMLWLHYLLTEEAQEILFVEHYSALPLHETAFTHAVQMHEELSVIETMVRRDTK